jgi:cyclopropane-fatty-acyl-phospholipid synthase
MKSNTLAIATRSQHGTRERWIDRLAKRIFLSKFSEITDGQLIVREADREYVFGEKTDSVKLSATIYIHQPHFYSDVIFGGTVGAGEAYMAGNWHCDELTTLVRILLRNMCVVEGVDSGFGKLMAPLHTLFHKLHRNTLTGSRRNIEAHYDLGNDMFEQFLDPTMMYSSGIFENEQMTMQQASEAKLERICRKLKLSADDHVLEIGSGWGGFAIYAASHYGCRVTTTTISQQQYEYAKQRIAAAGLNDRINLLCKDYRSLTGQFDKLVSIEMVEAVGHAFYKTYFQHCSDLLKPEGMMLLQSITIADQRYEAAKHEVDFIQRYIFPGGCLPSVSIIADTVTRSTDMRIYHLEDIGLHYATTLRKWRQQFFKNINKIEKLGYSDTFTRMWDFYLCYCEGGFMEHAIGTVQVLLTKPECRREPVLCPAASMS